MADFKSKLESNLSDAITFSSVLLPLILHFKTDFSKLSLNFVRLSLRRITDKPVINRQILLKFAFTLPLKVYYLFQDSNILCWFISLC